ncbi:NmrA family protein [Rhodococcus sp. AD45-ID]|uniref:SDR family oxidoreductase n=1 Tax=unclassified Rhodococcus (in: high G+C Gram-positive bacteria) TaxID=192944 RepID=UPI0005D3272A|nr:MULTISPECIES: SDR family oxidoreductase [unclassified Rhodococcus (in: high G+C Gram-positive bacteria)]KJF21035.1 NmrA-like family protein [Rhodococcus sp. AD45]PSR38579.1 NmrA family protein [Rhodococcus sp. AD45-ID]
MRIAVLGGTGLMGKLVVAEAEAAGHDVVIAARSTGVDISTGAGLAGALAGVDAVVDVSDHVTNSAKKAVAFFEAAAQNIAAAENAAGVKHHVVLSIVNCDDPRLKAFGYYQGKAAQERAVSASGIPFTILRSAQWFEFGEKTVSLMGFGPLALVPRMRSKPVAAKTVAKALVQAAEKGPSGRAADLAGPEVLEIPEMTRKILRRRGTRKLLIPVSMPGAGKAMRSGALLPGADSISAGPTLDEWLGSH